MQLDGECFFFIVGGSAFGNSNSLFPSSYFVTPFPSEEEEEEEEEDDDDDEDEEEEEEEQ